MNRVFLTSAACIAALCLCAAAPPKPVLVTKAIVAPAHPVAVHLPLRSAPSHRRPRSSRHRLSPVLHTVGAATAAATEEPDRQGFVNAVQIYPYADGMVFHAYTAPGQVTDIALQAGETLGAGFRRYGPLGHRRHDERCGRRGIELAIGRGSSLCRRSRSVACPSA
jgi:type IV secretion system protein VirB9